jgi:Fe2+ transport system protein B
MTDLASKRGIEIDVPALARELGMPVVSTVAVNRGGASELIAQLEAFVPDDRPHPPAWLPPDVADVTATQREVRRILAATLREPALDTRLDERIDRVVLHPLSGMLILATTLFLMFQAVFSWASLPMDLIKSAVEALGEVLTEHLPDTILRSLLVDGIVAGVGSVLVFLPQILILFLFILALEDSGYLPRAAFLLDRLMGSVVLWFLSSFPLPPEGAAGPAIQYSYAGMLGHALEVVFAPIGFNWQISIALVPAWRREKSPSGRSARSMRCLRPVTTWPGNWPRCWPPAGRCRRLSHSSRGTFSRRNACPLWR